MTVVKKITTRLKMMIAKALIKSVDDSNEIQLLKLNVLDGETPDGIERAQEYGLTSNPPVDTGALVASIAGNRDHQVVLSVCDGAHRVKNLNVGEVCFYSEHGQKIVLKNDGTFVFNDGVDAAALASKVDGIIARLDSVFRNWVPVAQDGGAALKTAYMSEFLTPPETVESEEVKLCK